MAPHRRSHVFVLRAGRIIALQQAAGERWWELPGGELLPGEPPAAAVVRETLEETGLRISAPELLREWRYHNRRDEEVQCYAFAGTASDGDVVLSDEHTSHAWLTIDEYERRYCSEEAAATAPVWAQQFLAEMRENCERFRRWHARTPLA